MKKRKKDREYSCFEEYEKAYRKEKVSEDIEKFGDPVESGKKSAKETLEQIRKMLAI